jgi:hypothetical protein
MPRTYDNCDAICPFFETSRVKSVTCEGIDDKGRICLLFSDTKKRLEHRRTFCDRKYEECQIFKLVMQKYE